MNTIIETLALLLPADDREAVLGDLEELGRPAWSCAVAILGFAIRQQAECWRGWRAWAVGGLVIPATLLLLGASFRLAMESRGLWHNGHIGASLFYQMALIIAWAWAAGFALGSLSRRTGWISPLLFAGPCLTCLLEFHQPSLSSVSLFLFIPPGLLGIVPGRRSGRMDFATAMILAAATAGIMLLWRGMPVSNWLLLLPALYLLWTSAKPGGPRREMAR